MSVCLKFSHTALVVILSVATIGFALAGEGTSGQIGSGEEGQATTELANPSATFCIRNGGRYEIRTAVDGGQTGVCVLPDGRVVDAWQYLRENN